MHMAEEVHDLTENEETEQQNIHCVQIFLSEEALPKVLMVVGVEEVEWYY